jgi:hypothetical protein
MSIGIGRAAQEEALEWFVLSVFDSTRFEK